MPERRAQVLSRLLVLVLLVIPGISAAAAPAHRPAAPRSGGGETVDVEIKIVPFYAVDAEGKPVWDLRSDEVELRLGGKPMFIDTFDGPAAPGGAERTGSNGLRPASRNVVFFVDTAFTSPAGLRNSVQVAEKLAGEVPEGDRLFLMTYSIAKGLEKRLGPVPADRRGKAKLLEALAQVMPEVRRLSTNPGADLPPLMQVEHGTQNGNRDDKPTSQFMGETDSMNAFGRSEYMGIARGLAESIDVTAAELRHLRGPKLFLVFWEGLDPDLFFNGDIGFKPGSTASTSYGGQRTSGVMLHFTKPLQALADSGAMTVFVNPTAPSGVGHDADGPIRQIAQTAGAYYTGGGDPRQVEERVAAETAAYYEAGFYVKGDPKSAREAVEVVVKRPGVKAWAPAALKVRETYEGLTAYEKRLLVLGLVAGGPESQHGPVRLDLHGLGGAVQSRVDGKNGRRLRYDASWPADLKGKDVDVYSVALAPPVKGQKTPTVLQFDSKERARAGGTPLEVALEKSSSLIWGIVAVEPGTGRAWYRRLQLQGEKGVK
jgi:hypothetical protein